MRTFVVTAFVLVLGLINAPAATVLKEGDRVPQFSITTEQGKHVSPAAFGGRILVINFWETACAPCIKELPSLTAFAQKFRPERVVVVAIGADEDGPKYQAFLRAHHVALQTYRDPTRALSKRFGTYMFPETYIIQDGHIIRKVIGGIDWMGKDIESFLNSHLGTH